MFSIIIPLYNKSQFILRSINAVLNQSFTDWELIIIDDGSTDDGPKKVLPLSSEKINVIQQENKGVSHSRNHGISLAKFPYVAFLDADDYWHSDYLYLANKAITSNSLPGFIGTSYLRFNNQEDISENEKAKFDLKFEILGIKDFFDVYLLNTLFFTSSIIIKKDFFLNNCGFDANIKFGEDLDVWFRTILNYQSMVYVKNPLVFYSKEDANSATKRNYFLTQTLIPKIIDDKYYNISNLKDKEDQKAFLAFRIKWIYLRLYPLYLNKENRIPLKNLVDKLPKKYMLIGIFYRLPFKFFNSLISNRRLKKYFKEHILRSYKTIYRS